ncbi:MAG: diadenylate cyclase [Syntrophobacterales bacterium]|nr:diadenylate cyclase [Syntrophobacterales bacterium]
MKGTQTGFAMLEYTLKIIKMIRLLDILDIAIISFMISAILIWFKDRASRFVFLGITLLGAIYIIARFFELYLTTVFLQSFFAILLFVLVVIFQEDLRRFFERLAMLGRFRKMFSPAASFNESADILAETAADFARKKIGALIVIQGKDPLDRHLTGGNELAGVISKALLDSVFDPHSSGHDGAVLVEGNRVMRFGCHLPLSANASTQGNLGLRHTAALGLSERSDAICIVVSEESGDISLASGEKIRKIANASALRVELEAFFEKNGALSRQKPFLRWLKENTREKVLAIVLACILWVVFGYQREIIRREFAVPIEYLNAPMELVIEEPKIAEANVMLMGQAQALQLLNPADLKISLDLEKIRPGKQEILLTGKMVKNAPNLSVTSIRPEKVIVSTSRLLPVSVPIEAITDNKPPAGIEVESITVTPRETRVLIPKTLSGKRVRIITEPVDLSQLDVQRAFTPSLRYPKEIRFVSGKPPVVRVVIKTRHVAPETSR